MSSATYIDKVKAQFSNPVVLNVFWLSFDKLFRLVIGLVVGVWVARYLGPSQWGDLNYVVAIISIVTTLSNLGMDGFLVREILEHPAKKNDILGTAFIMRTAIVPVLCLFVIMYLQFVKGMPDFALLFVLLSLNIFAVPFDLIDVEFQSKLKSRLTVTSKNLAYFFGGIIKITLILTQKSIFWIAAAMGFETILAYVFLTYIYQKNNNILQWKFNKELARNFFVVGWPFMISNLTVILYMRLDQIMLQSLSNNYELGLFSSSAKITEIFTFIPMAIASSFLPSLVKAKKENQQEFIKSIQYFLNWMTKISLAIALAISILSPFIINILYGERFSGADQILVIHIWALIPMFLGVASGHYLVLQNLQKFSFYKTLVGLIVNVGLNYILIPEYGSMGAATATLISYFISAIFSNLIFAPTKALFVLQLQSFVFLFKFNK